MDKETYDDEEAFRDAITIYVESKTIDPSIDVSKMTPYLEHLLEWNNRIRTKLFSLTRRDFI